MARMWHVTWQRNGSMSGNALCMQHMDHLNGDAACSNVTLMALMAKCGGVT
jgi:hypothetical protein